MNETPITLDFPSTPHTPRTDGAPPASTPRKLRRRALAGLFAAALLGGAAIFCAFRFERPAPVEPPHAAGLDVENAADGARIAIRRDAPHWNVLKLSTVESAQAGWTDPVPGRVKIDDRLASKVGVTLGGRVSKVLVDLGQKVKQGDPLFIVSSPDFADLRAQKDKADVDLEAARTTMERVQAMVESHALPAKEELTAKQQLKQAELSQKLAVAKLETLHMQSDDGQTANEFVVTSPRDGVVVEKNLVANQVVTPDGSSLLVVADLSAVWVVAELFEDDATVVHDGTTAEVTTSRAPNGPMQATVDMISAIVDPSRHTVPIRVRVANADGALRPNAYATVRFATRPDEKAVSIPATAIVSDGARQYVYVRGANDRFMRREIVVGATSNGRTTVLDHLAQGETVVAEGAILLDNQIQLGG
jgi:RND family efflux transporter MFP subunit